MGPPAQKSACAVGTLPWLVPASQGGWPEEEAGTCIISLLGVSIWPGQVGGGCRREYFRRRREQSGGRVVRAAGRGLIAGRPRNAHTDAFVFCAFVFCAMCTSVFVSPLRVPRCRVSVCVSILLPSHCPTLGPPPLGARVLCLAASSVDNRMLHK